MLAIILLASFSSKSYAGTPPPWQYKNTGSNHTILIPDYANVKLNDDTLIIGDYVGVFYDSLGTLVCAGYSMWESGTTALSAWGADAGLDGFKSGEKFKWMVWDSSKGKEYKALATYDDENFPNYDTYTTNGMTGITSLLAFPEQRIDLHTGWNYFSSYITPYDGDLETMILQIDSLLVQFTDFSGVVYGPDIDFTAPVYYNAGDCYKIKISAPGTLNMYGFQPKAEDSLFFLSGSPVVLPYLRDEATSIEALFKQNYSDIELIKDEEGKLFWPAMDRFSVTSLSPGKAYEIVCNTSFEFSYPGNDTLLPVVNPQVESATVFYIPQTMTGENMSLGIPYSAWNILPEMGDEVGVFTPNGRLVGAGVFDGMNMGLTVWGDDLTSAMTDGLLSGEVFKLKLWRKSDGFEDVIKVLQWEQGDSVYSHDRIAVISSLEIKQDPVERAFGFELISDFVSHSYTLSISMEEPGPVEFYFYNLKGQKVQTLLSTDLPIGKHNFPLSLAWLPSGVYYFVLEDKNEEIVQQVPIFRFE